MGRATAHNAVQDGSDPLVRKSQIGFVISMLAFSLPCMATAGNEIKPVDPSSVKYWSLVATQLNKTGEVYTPFTRDGLPVLGYLPHQSLGKQQHRNREREQNQTACVLAHRCNPGGVSSWIAPHVESAYEDVDDPTQRLIRMSLEWLWPEKQGTMMARTFYDNVNRSNVFTRREAYPAAAKRLDNLLTPLRSDAPIELWIASNTKIGEYDERSSEFVLSIDKEYATPKTIGGYPRRIKLTWPTTHDLPDRWKMSPNQARSFLGSAPRREVTVLTRVRLTSLRWTEVDRRHSSSSQQRECSAQAAVMETRLLAATTGLPMLTRFAPSPRSDNPEERLSPSKGHPAEKKDAIAARMRALAAEYKLKTKNGGIFVPASGHGASDAEKAYRFRVSELLDRVAVSLNPRNISPVFIAYRFPESVGSEVVVTRRGNYPPTAVWAGRDEHEQKTSEQRAMTKYRKRIDQTPIPLPLRFCIASPLSLDGYDFKSQSFRLQSFGKRWGHHVHYPSMLPNPVSFNLSRSFHKGLYQHPLWLDFRLPATRNNAPAIARAHDTRQNKAARPLRLAAIFRVDRILAASSPNAPQEIPDLACRIESLELFRDQSLTQPIHRFDLHQLPSPVTVTPRETTIPARSEPVRLDHDVLMTWLKEADTERDTTKADQYRVRFERPLWDRWDEVMIRLQNNAHRLFQERSRRDSEPDKIAEVENRLRSAREALDELVASAPSPFWPWGYKVDEKTAVRATKAFAAWHRKRLKSRSQFTLAGRLFTDAHTDAVTLRLGDESESQSDAYRELPPGIVADLRRTTPKSRLCLLSSVLDERAMEEIRSSTDLHFLHVVLRLPNEPKQIFAEAPLSKISPSSETFQSGAKVSVEFGRVGVQLLRDPDTPNREVLMIDAKPINGVVRVKEKVIYDGALASVNLPSPARPATPLTRKSNAASERPSVTAKSPAPTMLSPASLPRILATFNMDLLSQNVLQHMRKRQYIEWQYRDYIKNHRQIKDQLDATLVAPWKRRLFKADRNLDQVRKSGIDPTRGLFFPPDSDAPDSNTDPALRRAFLDWMAGRRYRTDATFAVDINVRFGTRRNEAYAMRASRYHQETAIANTASRINWAADNLKRLREQFRRDGVKRVPDKNGGPPILLSHDPMTNQGYVDQLNELNQFKLLSENLHVPERWISLSEIGDLETLHVVPNLQGHLQARPDNSDTRHGKWDPDRKPLLDPLLPVLELDKNAFLPTSAGIKPARQSFPVRLTFKINRIDALDALPKEDPNDYRSINQRLNYAESGPTDYGRYLAMRVQLLSAQIVHPEKRTPMIDLELRPAIKPTPLNKLAVVSVKPLPHARPTASTKEAMRVEEAIASDEPKELTETAPFTDHTLGFLASRYLPEFAESRLRQLMIDRWRYEKSNYYGFRPIPGLSPEKNAASMERKATYWLKNYQRESKKLPSTPLWLGVRHPILGTDANNAVGVFFENLDHQPIPGQLAVYEKRFKTWHAHAVAMSPRRFRYRTEDFKIGSGPAARLGSRKKAPLILGETGWYEGPDQALSVYATAASLPAAKGEKLEPWLAAISVKDRHRSGLLPDAYQRMSRALPEIRRRLETSPPFLKLTTSILDLDGKWQRYKSSDEVNATGIPIVGNSENPLPVLPLIKLDKEMWLPENAAMGRGATPAVEIEFEVIGAKLLDAPPPHPWTVAINEWRTLGYEDMSWSRPASDLGDYVALEARLLSARIIDTSATNKELFRLDLTPHPDVVSSRVSSDVSVINQ